MPFMSPRTGPRALSLVSLLIVLGVATVIVDSPGRWTSGYGVLQHAGWEGLRAADLFAPAFVFFLGACVAIVGASERWGTILIPAAILIALGLIVSGYPHFDPARWRIPGTLQRAGVCYLSAAVMLRVTTGDARRRGAIFVSAAIFLTLAYWLVMTHAPVPGATVDDLSPEGNLAGWLDRTVLRSHMWSARWDPDGLLSTLSSVSTAMIGVVAGMCMASELRPGQKAARLGGAGVGAVVGGLLFDPMFPLNRALWSSSFMIASGGVASLLLAVVGSFTTLTDGHRAS